MVERCQSDHECLFAAVKFHQRGFQIQKAEFEYDEQIKHDAFMLKREDSKESGQLEVSDYSKYFRHEAEPVEEEFDPEKEV